MKFFYSAVLLVALAGNAFAALSIYQYADDCLKELQLEPAKFKDLIEHAPEGGITEADYKDMKKVPGGTCLLKCMMVKKGYFTAAGELIVNPEAKKNSKLAQVDLDKCELIKKEDVCEDVVDTAICINEQIDD